MSDNISIVLRSISQTDRNYRMRFFENRVNVLVTKKPRSVRKWISRRLRIHHPRFHFHRRRRFIVGLAAQWNASETPCRPATIQLALGQHVLIFRIQQSRSVPASLIRLLSDRRVTFVGYNITNASRFLSVSYGLVIARTVDIETVAGMGNAAMNRIVERVLGYDRAQLPRQVLYTMWDAQVMTRDEVKIAALNAYLSFLVGLRLVARR